VTRLLRHHAEIKVRMPQPQDAATPAQRPARHTWVWPLKTIPFKNYYYCFCVPHHAYASVIAWFLKTKALRWNAPRLGTRKSKVLKSQGFRLQFVKPEILLPSNIIPGHKIKSHVTQNFRTRQNTSPQAQCMPAIRHSTIPDEPTYHFTIELNVYHPEVTLGYYM
jgi:hypothetical protein